MVWCRKFRPEIGVKGGWRRWHLFENSGSWQPGHCAPDVFHHNNSRTPPRGLSAERIIKKTNKKKTADWFAAHAPGGSSWQWMSAHQLGISFYFFFFSLKGFRSYSLNLLAQGKTKTAEKNSFVTVCLARLGFPFGARAKTLHRPRKLHRQRQPHQSHLTPRHRQPPTSALVGWRPAQSDTLTFALLLLVCGITSSNIWGPNRR